MSNEGVTLSWNWSITSSNEFELVFTQMNHRNVFGVKLHFKSFEMERDTWPMSVCFAYADIAVWLWFDRVNKFFEIRWWNSLWLVCVFDLCILLRQRFIDLFVQSNACVCEFRYVRFIRNESGIIIKRKTRNRKFLPLILTWLERWIGIESWRHSFLTVTTTKSKNTEKENILYLEMWNFSHGNREYRSEGGIATASCY